MEILRTEPRLPDPVRPFADYIASAVRSLFAVETQTLVGVERKMEEAMTRLRHLLHAMQEPTAMVPALQDATEAVAKSLAILYPAHRELTAATTGLPTNSLGPAKQAPSRPSSNPPDSERRDRARMTVHADIGMQSDTNFYTGISGDLSIGGLFVATDSPLTVGTHLTLSFILPVGHHVVVEGTVSWRRTGPEEPAGMGVRFAELSNSDLAAILAFIERRAPLKVRDAELRALSSCS